MHHHPKFARNARNPLRVDPTRTLTIRNRFVALVGRFMRDLRGALWQLVVKDDAFGLTEPRNNLAGLARREFAFLTDEAKVAAFHQWLSQHSDLQVVRSDVDTFIESAYKRGQLNAYLGTKQAQLLEELGVGGQSAEDFLRSSFAQPETLSKVRLLATRSFEQLKGVTATMSSEMNRIFAEGLAQGQHPTQIARTMNQRITSLTKQRAHTIARTEVIHAHAEGQLDAFNRLGVKEVGVVAEWVTAGDDRVCPDCQSLEGETFSIDKARGLIPYHPNCRCTWSPIQKEVETPKPKPPPPTGVTPPAPTAPRTTTGPVQPSKTMEQLNEELKAISADFAIQAERARQAGQFLGDEFYDDWRIQFHRAIGSRMPEKKKGNIFRKKKPKELAAKADEVEDWIRDIVNPEHLKKQCGVEAHEDWPSGRAYYRNWSLGGGQGYKPGKVMRIAQHDDASIMAHEFGHHLQYNGKKIMQREKAFLKKRMGINKNSKLEWVGSGDKDEVGFFPKLAKDRFSARGTNDYASKVYGARQTPTGLWNWRVGEVTSMGLERLYKNPFKFWREDPDYFNFIVDSIQRPG